MIWMNHAATSFPKPESVYQARDSFFRKGLAGVHRSSGENDKTVNQIVLQTKKILADMFGGALYDVFFTSGATESLNIVIANIPQEALVISTKSRHNAIRRPLYARGLKQVVLPPLTLNNYQQFLDQHLQPHAWLILNATSNVNGHCEPVQEICEYLKNKYPSVRVVVDAAQAAGHFPILMEWGIDYLVLTAHKGLYGPPGLGALITPHEIQPLIFGGTGAHSLDLETNRQHFEAGTRDISSIAAWKEGLLFVASTGIETIRNHEQHLKKHFLDRIQKLPISTYYDEASIVSVSLPGISSEEVVAMMEAENIIIRGGMHCAPEMHQFLNLKGAARFSFGWFNTIAEIDRVADVLHDIVGSRS
ncbi:MAG: aminotransferase class V-fold PLP-dependent enzyme [Brevinema sp.]